MGSWFGKVNDREKEVSQANKIYRAAKETGLFVNLVPQDYRGKGNQYPRPKDWKRIYGKSKHNLPHNFYLGVVGSDLVMAFDNGKIHWFNYPHEERQGVVPSLYRIETWKVQERESWPFLDEPDSLKHPTGMIAMEEILDRAPDNVRDFIIFNMDLFV